MSWKICTTSRWFYSIFFFKYVSNFVVVSTRNTFKLGRYFCFNEMSKLLGHFVKTNTTLYLRISRWYNPTSQDYTTVVLCKEIPLSFFSTFVLFFPPFYTYILIFWGTIDETSCIVLYLKKDVQNVHRHAVW